VQLGPVSMIENSWRLAGSNHEMGSTHPNISLGRNYLALVWGLWSKLIRFCCASEVIGCLGWLCYLF
jgi:hypothetical protein